MEKIDQLVWQGVFAHLAQQHNTQGLGTHERAEVYVSLAETADRVVELRQMKRGALALGAQHAGAVVGGRQVATGSLPPPLPPQQQPAQQQPPAPPLAPQLAQSGVETPPGMKVIQVAGIGPVFVPDAQQVPEANG